jgi:hypothetical protein
MQIINAPSKPFSWSFSAVDNFHTCAKLYYHRTVLKDVSDDTTYRTEGGIVHKMMQARLVHAKPLPKHLQHWDRWVDEVLDDCDRTTTYLASETRLAMTEDFEPCDYFDKERKVWCRAQLDVLKIREPWATVWDWKTGKVKPDLDQLMLYATLVFVHYPDVKIVNGGLIFLKQDTGPSVPRNNCTYEVKIVRADLKPFWQRYEHKVNALERALLTNEFPPNPSGLCRNHCPVHSCTYNGHYQ